MIIETSPSEIITTRLYINFTDGARDKGWRKKEIIRFNGAFIAQKLCQKNTKSSETVYLLHCKALKSDARSRSRKRFQTAEHEQSYSRYMH